ncbi:MAG: hypothetical protein SF029_13365 [bacterium]|nr:hypothetical protein [bacterium]
MTLPNGTYGFPDPSIFLSFDNGRYTGVYVTPEGEQQVFVEGHYSVEGDQITMTDESGPRACLETPTATYQWTFDGTQLSMHPVEDPCDERLSVLNGAVLTHRS